MSPTIIKIATALVAHINAGVFDVGPFTAERAYQSDIGAEDVKKLVVRVAPLGGSMERQDTGSWSDRHELEIGIVKKLTPERTEAEWIEETDGLIGFVQQLYEYIRDVTLTIGTDEEAEVDSVIYDVAYSKEDMLSRGEFSVRLAIAYEIP